MSSPATRIPNQAALTALRAMIGANISVEDATDILDAVRVHIEFPFQAHIASLQAELAQAREEIARLSQVSA